MKLIRRSQVPQYLQKGSFFEALDPNDDEKFGVPSDCLKPDLTITSDEDLKQLLRSVRFWSVYKMPNPILSHIRKAAVGLTDSLQTEFPEFKDHITKILALRVKCLVVAPKQKSNLKAVKLIREQMGFALDPKSWESRNDISCTVYLEDPDPKDTSNFIAVPAAQYNSIGTLSYVHLTSQTMYDGNLDKAVMLGNEDCLKFLFQECRLVSTVGTMLHASKFSTLAAVCYLHETGCPWNEEVCASFAAAGHLDRLTYAHEKGCPWDVRTCQAAAEAGHLPCLEYAHLQGCPWDVSVCAAAAQAGHLQCLEYAHQQGCPWDMTIFHKLKDPVCGNYAFERGCPALSGVDEVVLMSAAVGCASLALLFAWDVPWILTAVLAWLVLQTRALLQVRIATYFKLSSGLVNVLRVSFVCLNAAWYLIVFAKSVLFQIQLVVYGGGLLSALDPMCILGIMFLTHTIHPWITLRVFLKWSFKIAVFTLCFYIMHRSQQ